MKYLNSFQHIAKQLDPKLLASMQMEVWTGAFQDCVVLKLFKRSWANPSHNPVNSPTRIFFSIWINPNNEQELLYNIHAFKLRHMRGYRIESRKFAERFRNGFKPFESQWKNVSTKFGPLTLMQGLQKIDPAHFQPEALDLAARFFNIQHLIDDTLAEFRV